MLRLDKLVQIQPHLGLKLVDRQPVLVVDRQPAAPKLPRFCELLLLDRLHLPAEPVLVCADVDVVRRDRLERVADHLWLVAVEVVRLRVDPVVARLRLVVLRLGLRILELRGELAGAGIAVRWRWAGRRVVATHGSEFLPVRSDDAHSSLLLRLWRLLRRARPRRSASARLCAGSVCPDGDLFAALRADDARHLAHLDRDLDRLLWVDALVADPEGHTLERRLDLLELGSTRGEHGTVDVADDRRRLWRARLLASLLESAEECLSRELESSEQRSDGGQVDGEKTDAVVP